MKLTALRTLAFAGALALALPANAADTWTIDAAHSHVMFRIKHFDASWQYGRFNDPTGTLVWDEADPSKSTLTMSVKTTDVDTHNQKRDDHLRGPDFFDAAQFPELSFKSKKIVKKAGSTYTITGDLTVHGVTKEVTTDFEHVGVGQDPWGGTRTGAEAVFNIKRSDFGMNGMIPAVGDDVRLIISFEAIKK